MTKAAIYLRVSRDDLTFENQRPELERMALLRGFDVVARFEETVSAAKIRPEHKRMMAGAIRGDFQVVLVWSLDRFGRSMEGNIRDVLQLDAVRVRLVSVQEPWLDTGGPVRDLLLAIFSWVAEQERRRLIERTRAGLDRARAAGKRFGRPPRVTADVVRACARLRLEGRSTRAIAVALKLPATSVRRALKAAELAQIALAARGLDELGSAPQPSPETTPEIPAGSGSGEGL